MTNLLGDLNAKVGRGEVFKPTIGNESLHQNINDNDLRIVNFDILKNLALKSTMLPHRNIHKYGRTCLDGKTNEQINHILIDRRWHSVTFDVRSFIVADCDTDKYLVAAKHSERLAVIKLAAQTFDVKRLNLRKLSELELKKHYHSTI
jgi:hypothetical protein